MYIPSHVRDRYARERTIGCLLNQKAAARRRNDQKRVAELEREIRELERLPHHGAAAAA